MCGHRDLGLTEAKVRGAIRVLEEVGFLQRIVPEPGRRYQRTADRLYGLIVRQPLRRSGRAASLPEWQELPATRERPS